MRAMTLRLPDEVHEALRREAFESRRSMNEVMLDALTSVARMRADLKEWETSGADAWVDAKYRATQEARVQAWDEGASDGVWNHEHEAMIERGNRTAITNPYREGSK